MATGRRVEFLYSLEGDVAEVDVFRLAPALLALGHVIQEGNRTLNRGEGPEIAVNVRPFGQGSFLVDVILGAAASAVPVLAALGPDPVQKISDVLKVIGFIRGAATSVLDVIRKLGGKPENIDEIRPGEVRVTYGTTSVTTNGQVRDLLVNPVFNNYIYDAYKPLEDERITDIKTSLKDQEDSTTVTVPKSEIRAIREYATSAGPLVLSGERVLENTLEAFIKPRRGPFSGEKARWSFTMGGVALNNVRIRDETFLRDYDRGAIRLNQGDLLRVRLLQRQRVVGAKVEAAYEVVEVLEYIRAPEQPSLPGTSN